MRNLIKERFKWFGDREAKHPRGTRNATVIAVSALKGGVGKTTTAVNLAAALARHADQRVLLVDLDPQGHVGASLSALVRPGGAPLSALLTAEKPGEVLDAVTTTEIAHLHVTPRDGQLAEAEALLTARMGKEFILRDALQLTRTHYDLIVIDCPPNLGNLTLNALVAADYVLVPCDPSSLALEGVDALIRAVGTVAQRLNPEIDLLGVVLTRYDARNASLNEAVVAELERAYGPALLPVRIGINTGLAKAQSEGQDIFAFDPKSRGADHYRQLAETVLERLRHP